MTSDDTHSSSSDNLAGVLLDGKFLVKELIAFGGFGSVYRARQDGMERDVAIKLLHRRYSIDPEAVKRFRQEARIIASLRHQHILSVYSMGTHEDRIYMVMELVSGQSMSDVLLDRGAMPAHMALPLLLQVCRAMSYAHQSGIIHRDLKPSNILISADEKAEDGSARIRVVDFGLAKLLTDGQKLTRTGAVVGDPTYMSPEQAQGKQLDARSDIYSFGCLMYQLFTGSPPFVAESAMSLMYKQVCEQPPPLPSVIKLPAALPQVVATALEKDPNNRFQSFDEIAGMLSKIAANPNVTLPRRAKVKAPKRSLGGAKQVVLIASATMALASLLAGILQYFESERTKLDASKGFILEQLDLSWNDSTLHSRYWTQDLLKMTQATGDPDLIARVKLGGGCIGNISPEEALSELPADAQLAPELVEEKRYIQALLYYDEERWRDAESIFQDFYDKYLLSGTKTRANDSRFSRFVRFQNRPFVLHALARAKFHLGKFDECETLIRKISDGHRWDYSSDDRKLLLYSSIAKHGFAAVERSLKHEVEAQPAFGHSMSQLISLYGIWGDSRVPKMGVDYLHNSDNSSFNFFYVMKETLAVGSARQDYATLEHCYSAEIRDGSRLLSQDLVALASAKYEMGKIADAETTLDEVRAETISREYSKYLDWQVARTRFQWRVREKRFAEAEKLLNKMPSSGVSNWDRYLLTLAESKQGDAQWMKNSLLSQLHELQNPDQQIDALWLALKSCLDFGVSDTSAIEKNLRAAYEKMYGSVPERVLRQLEVIHLYSLFRAGRYADVVERARPLVARFMSTHGTGFAVSQLIEPYCISLDRIGQHREANAARKSMAEYVFFERVRAQDPVRTVEEASARWKRRVCVDQFSCDDFTSF